MATAGELGNQLGDLTEDYMNIGTFDPGKTRKTFLDKVKSFKPQFEEKARIDQQAYAAPADMMQGYYNEFGTAPGTGPSGMARLSSILNNIGNLYGRSDTLGGIIDMQGGRIDNMVGEIGDQAAREQQNIMNAFNMIMPRYQQANNRIENIENREIANEQFNKGYALDEATLIENIRQFNEKMAFDRANVGRTGGGIGDYIDYINSLNQGNQEGNVNGESDPYGDFSIEIPDETGGLPNTQGALSPFLQNLGNTTANDWRIANQHIMNNARNRIGNTTQTVQQGIGNFFNRIF